MIWFGFLVIHSPNSMNAAVSSWFLDGIQNKIQSAIANAFLFQMMCCFASASFMQFVSGCISTVPSDFVMPFAGMYKIISGTVFANALIALLSCSVSVSPLRNMLKKIITIIPHCGVRSGRRIRDRMGMFLAFSIRPGVLILL